MSEIITPPQVVKGDQTHLVGETYGVEDEEGVQYVFTITDAYYRPLTRESVLTVTGTILEED